MDYRLEIESIDKFIWIRAFGQKSLQDALSLWQKVAQLCKQNNLTRVLLEDYMTGSLSAFETIQLLENFGKIGMSWEYWVALIAPKSKTEYEDIKLKETVAYNRGWGQIKVFEDLKTATDWLVPNNQN
jgi:hypothetical protein